ncbi:MAG: 4-(cytidine 5'-diphospho)-2-C-methyl-D-erythritol kinase [Pseudomonadota bacterium]
MIVEFAPAKINLALHVVGQRPDGYHRLDTLIAFASIGDRLIIEKAETSDLRLTGPFATDLDPDADNLVVQARTLLTDRYWAGRTPLPAQRILLEKNLPVASGIGGGSADAAAAFRGLNLAWKLERKADALARDALPLGADIPMCIAGRAARVRGIGERIDPIEPFPSLSAVLVNPGVSVPTPGVFRRLQRRKNVGLPAPVPVMSSADTLIDYLAGCRNDLEAPALAIAPEIGTALGALTTTGGCRLARMSGSGATCFALYDDDATAQAAAREVKKLEPTWWVRACRIEDRPALPDMADQAEPPSAEKTTVGQ